MQHNLQLDTMKYHTRYNEKNQYSAIQLLLTYPISCLELLKNV